MPEKKSEKVVKKTVTKKTATKAAPKKSETSKKTLNSSKLREKKTVQKAERVSASASQFPMKNLESLEGKGISRKEKSVPTWIIVIFIFSLVFFLFALYKAFIYGQGYNDVEPIDLPPLYEDQEGRGWEGSVSVSTTWTQQKVWISNMEQITRDTKVIQDFYAYLANNQITDMNALVDRPLKNSVVWGNHRNKKNIQIFTKHLADTISLQNIFLIPGSTNREKHTRQYSYTLQYAVQPQTNFSEEREITLVDKSEKTLISAIMCKTEGCSHSPFFWPQNYGLK